MTGERTYRFVQLEFPWPLGPEDGRYLLREHAGEEAHHVLVIGSVAAPARPRQRRWGRAQDATAAPTEVGIGRATLIDPETVAPDEAVAWLESATGAETDAAVDDAIRWLNHALRMHRAASADGTVREVAESQALAIRAGFGEGFEVAEGEWTSARTVPARRDRGPSGRSRRMDALRPQERLAALLAGRDAVLACEELTLRARADLDAGRPREAALQAHVAVESAVAELAAFRDQFGMGERVDELDGLRPALSAAADEALHRGPSEATIEAVGHAIGRLEAALRARAASAVY